MSGSPAPRTTAQAPRPGNDVEPTVIADGIGQPKVAFTDATAIRGVRWSLAAVLSRQGLQMLCALVLARILGPETYGIISAATVYITLTALLLDQGFSAALVQRADVTRRHAGATATLNLTIATLLAAGTILAAPSLASFFRADALAPLLTVLAISLPLKALSVTPRAMLSRELLLHHIARADIIGAAAGAAAGITAAAFSAGYFSLAYQVLATDTVTALLMLIAARGPLPNFRFRAIAPMLAFSSSVFFTNCLSYFSRNIDNILIGRFLGVGSLSLYSMSYRIMVLPVQLIGQTLNRIMFPAFARAADDPRAVAEHLMRSIQILAFSVVPLMAYVASAAPFLIHMVLGDAWAPAAALVSVLAIGGARETVFYVAPSLMKGMGRGKLIIQYEILAAVVQVGGIVIGLQFGALGVAVGLVAAGFALTPILLVIQSRLSGIKIRKQLGACWPPVHAAVWASIAHFAVTFLPVPPLVQAIAGLVAFGAAAILVLVIFHRRSTAIFVRQGKALLGLPKRASRAD